MISCTYSNSYAVSHPTYSTSILPFGNQTWLVGIIFWWFPQLEISLLCGDFPAMILRGPYQIACSWFSIHIVSPFISYYIHHFNMNIPFNHIQSVGWEPVRLNISQTLGVFGSITFNHIQSHWQKHGSSRTPRRRVSWPPKWRLWKRRVTSLVLMAALEVMACRSLTWWWTLPLSGNLCGFLELVSIFSNDWVRFFGWLSWAPWFFL